MTPTTNIKSPFTYDPNTFTHSTTLSSSDDADSARSADGSEDPVGSGPPTCGTTSTPSCPAA